MWELSRYGEFADKLYANSVDTLAEATMHKLAICLGFCLVLVSGATRADEYVNGYFRGDGTYVQPYYRSSPDDSYNNNWSVAPNINPYTGEMGTRQPTWDDQPPASYGGFGSGCGMNC